ncbi:type 1 fimbrial protein [Achromobacter sp. SD115]|uniref:fimbrial protein n=1 Tax=Achromobacter sp. SD115 TaxID=2782011 RepID=UPI001A95C5F7|nr:fimbrial protein [Achromobacter sp. SD115]MBO1014697.1 type 1 fimbrial protein [Achromobacter sp. SD115]
MKIFRNLYSFGVMLLLLALSPSAYAGLCPYSGNSALVHSNVKLVVDPKTPDGTVLLSFDTVANGKFGGPGSCLSGNVLMSFEGVGARVGPNIFETGIRGVGARLTLTGGTCATGLFPVSCTARFGPDVNNIGLRVELIKTGPMTESTISRAPIGKMLDNYVHPTNPSLFAYFLVSGTVEILKPPTCSVSSSGPIKAPLGSFPASSFKGVGSTSSARPFSIDLKCSGGNAGMSREVYATLTDATNTGNRSNVLTLSPDSQARGVGIEILKGDAVLGYGPDSQAVGNVNQWYAGSVSTGTGTYSIPLSARYVQTEPVVTNGSANGRATFTMSYQ